MTRMRLRTLTLSLLAAALLAAGGWSLAALAPRAHADTGATADTTMAAQGCYRYVLCSAQTATGVCTSAASGDQTVARLSGMARMTLYHDRSTASAYSCSIVTASQGYDAGGSSTGDTVSGSTFTEASGPLVFGPEEMPMEFLWATCSAITGGNVTVTVTACPSAK